MTEPADDVEPDPRWTLANERTLLAYTRTSLGLVAAGTAATGSYAASVAPAWLPIIGIPLIALGGVVGVTARRRYLMVERAMRSGERFDRPAVALALPLGVAVIAVTALVAAIVDLAS